MVTAVRSSSPSTTPYQTYTPPKFQVQEALAVAVASLSLSLGIFSVYWLLRLHRSVRHQLILMLVVSNLVKAFGFFVYPITEFATKSTYDSGPNPISRVLCLLNGFNICYGLEATDYVILLIAVHSMWTMFGPRSRINEPGLHRYRISAYVGFFISPLLMSLLVFIHSPFPYQSSGTFCYLPIKPIWYRLLLSWIPRYLIIIFIIAVYVAVYHFADYKYKEFFNTASGDHSSTGQLSGDNFTRPKTMDKFKLKLFCRQSQNPPNRSKSKNCQDHCNYANAHISRRQEEIKRRLMRLFVYPAIYGLMTIPLFVSHCWSFATNEAPPFTLTTVANLLTAGQCAADCIIFLTQDRPWHLVKEHDKAASHRWFFLPRRVLSDGMELAPVKTRPRPDIEVVLDRENWWEHQRYKVRDGTSEESATPS